jgi:hypothetical protein
VKSRGIQSIDVGGRLLEALARVGERMMLRDLAREAAMTPFIGQYSNQRTRTPIAPMIRERIGLRIVRRRAGSAQ